MVFLCCSVFLSSGPTDTFHLQVFSSALTGKRYLYCSTLLSVFIQCLYVGVAIKGNRTGNYSLEVHVLL